MRKFIRPITKQFGYFLCVWQHEDGKMYVIRFHIKQPNEMNATHTDWFGSVSQDDTDFFCGRFMFLTHIRSNEMLLIFVGFSLAKNQKIQTEWQPHQQKKWKSWKRKKCNYFCTSSWANSFIHRRIFVFFDQLYLILAILRYSYSFSKLHFAPVFSSFCFHFTAFLLFVFTFFSFHLCSWISFMCVFFLQHSQYWRNK